MTISTEHLKEGRDSVDKAVQKYNTALHFHQSNVDAGEDVDSEYLYLNASLSFYSGMLSLYNTLIAESMKNEK